MNVLDFAIKQKFYTGAINKRKWIITNPEILEKYLEECNFKPAILKDRLNISYASVKRLLCSAKLWNKVNIKKVKSHSKKRTSLGQHGYPYANCEFDMKNSMGETIRRFQHHVIAEKKIGRSLKDKEVVHHVNLIKFDNSEENIYVCRDNSEHRKIHAQLNEIAGELIRLGIIRFDHKQSKYINTLYEVDDE